MPFLALDLSKRCTGWALWDHGWASPRFGHWELGTEYTSNGGVYAKLHSELLNLRKVVRFECIWFEEAIQPGQLQGATNINTITLAIGLAEHVRSFAHAMSDCRAEEVNVSSWRGGFIGKDVDGTIRSAVRRHNKKVKATGHGKKKSATDPLKAATMERCRQLGWRVRKNDEADALGILDYKLALRDIQTPWRSEEVLRPMSEVG